VELLVLDIWPEDLLRVKMPLQLENRQGIMANFLMQLLLDLEQELMAKKMLP